MIRILTGAAIGLTLAFAQDAGAQQRKQPADNTAPTGEEPAIKPTKGEVRYGPHERNVIDFFQAKSDKPTPVAVYIHGGGFRKGGKHMLHRWYADVLEDCLDRGISVVSVNYRFRADATIPEIFRDAARAVQFTRAHAKEWNIDKTRFAAFGASAGGGTSLWLASHEDLADPKHEDPILRESSRIQVIGVNNCQATYNQDQAREIAGPPPPNQSERPSSPIPDPDTPEGQRYRAELNMLAMMTKDDAPVFLFCKYKRGDATQSSQYIHHPRHSIAIHKKAKELGLDTEMILKADHPDIQIEEVHQRMVKFFVKHFGMADGEEE